MLRRPAVWMFLCAASGAILGVVAAWCLYPPREAGNFSLKAPPRAAKESISSAPEVVFNVVAKKPPKNPDLLPAGSAIIYAFYQFPENESLAIKEVRIIRNGKFWGQISAADIRPDPQAPNQGKIVLRAPGGKWPAGIYEVQIHTVTRRLQASFVVAEGAEAIVAQPAPQEAEIKIVQLVLSRAVNEQGEPQKVGTKFTSRERIYCVVRYEKAEPGMTLCFRWWASTQELKAARQQVILPQERGWAYAWLQAIKETGLPSGHYAVTVHSEGASQELSRASFIIE